jgi:hypothetical protein
MSKRKTEWHRDLADELAEILNASDRMAIRVGGRFVVDADKLYCFIKAAAPKPQDGPRTVTVEEVARVISSAWLKDGRFPVWGPPAFWTEIAARAVLSHLGLKENE